MTDKNNHRTSKRMREIVVGRPGGLPTSIDPKTAKKIGFASNEISTTKYNKWSFFPKALGYQFLRFANIYFLITAIIQSIPYVSPLHPFSAIAPFIFVLAVSMAREGVEDFQRYKDDTVTNNKKSKVMRNGAWEEVKWKDIQVGDYLRITCDEKFPCDIVVLTTDLKKENKGTCYIETAQLDGERNLKPRMAISEIMDFVDQNNHANLVNFNGNITCQQPNADLHDFDGVIQFGDKKFSLSPKQLLLRGASLKNSQFAIGVAVYTGHDTKVMKNSENSRYKISKMEMLMNDLILKLLILQALLYFGSVVGFIAWNRSEKDKYINIPENNFQLLIESFFMIFTYFILYNTLLPISLIVTIEIVKVIQSYFISVDFSFYNEEKKTGCKVMTRSINEELGQVQYVFSDKTGTLTCNVMELKYLTVGSTTYEGKLIDETQPGVCKYAMKGGYFSRNLESTLDLSRTENWDQGITVSSFDGSTSYSIENDAQLLDEFFTLMSTCHDCVIDMQQDSPNVINFEGPSPDEVCLVSAARQHGYVFLGTTSNTSILDIKDNKVEFELVSLFQFDNKRKMMSVLIKHNGQYKLLAKGADSAILNKLSGDEQPFLPLIEQKLADYSKEGLRTLCMGVKVISEQELEQIKARILKIDSSENKKELLPVFLNEIESGFTLIGCSAVEDRLQDKVPEVIASLLEANIKVWMLTGDKMETAENIGLSCNLINSEFDLVRLKQYTEEKVQNYLGIYQEKINICRLKRKKVCTVIDGKCLGLVLKKKERAIQYLNLMKDCESVICCRVTPMQKADVVRLVKKNLGKTSLAIGDGANDVNMIQEGDIGVGIFGLEGRQAANASDFAVPEFKALYKLLFVHGRWSYLRNSEMILYFFFKNMLFTIPQLFFIFLNAYSGLSLFDDWYMTFYNMAFTAIPLMAKAILDQDVHYGRFKKINGKLVYGETKVIRKLMPYIYKIGQTDSIFNNKNFLIWILTGILQGFGIWFVSTYSLEYLIINVDGHNSDFWFKSITMFTSIVLIATLKLGLSTRFWTWLNIISITFLGSFIYFAFIWITNSFESMEVSRNQMQLWQSWPFYLIVVLNMGWFIAWEIGFTVASNLFYVSYDVLIKVMESKGKFKTMSDEDIVRIFSKKRVGFNKISAGAR